MTFLRSTLIASLLLTLLACGGNAGGSELPENPDDQGSDKSSASAADGGAASGGSTSRPKDAGSSVGTANKDAGSSLGSSSPNNARDAGFTQADPRDAGASAGALKDGGVAPSGGGGSSGVGALADAGSGFMIPNLFPATPDAGATTTPAKTGAKDGPCKDLMLLCFDAVDMFIINPSDCMTCNGGKGCQGCALPYAF
ncbi:MAG: hypothetical protein JWN48_4335 [Myxococcaceae bacterium]|nr:hypothetical protein [Myxococcaceae bacterium]